MIRGLAWCSLVLAILATRPDSAQAQIRARRYPSVSRPTVSPYLNLLRRDNNNRSFSALNYYTLVRPEQEFRARLDAQARGLDSLRGDVDANTQSIGQELRSTGHSSYFMNYGSYYPGFSSRPRR
jgi:hypothetical protein